MFIAVALVLSFFGHFQVAVSELPVNDSMFNKYLVDLRFHSRPALPLYNTPNSKTFRTRIGRGAAAGPNFADHYTLVSWGCGTDCVIFSIIDSVDGKVYDFPFSVSWINEKDSGLDYRRDSRAVHVVGSLNEGNNSADRWYVWDEVGLKLVSEQPAKHEDTSSAN